MRDQGGGMLLSPSSIERKKMSLKLSGKDEGVRKRAVYKSEGTYGQAPGDTKFLLPFGAGKLKAGSLISSSNGGRHHNEELHAMAKPSFDEGLNLPQWGHGKRSRCTRPDDKHISSSNVQEFSKSAPRPLKKPLSIAAPSSKLQIQGSSSKPSSSKFTGSDTPFLRNGVSNKSTNGSGRLNAFNTVRQVEEAKESSDVGTTTHGYVNTSSHGHVGTSKHGHVGTSNHGHALRTVSVAATDHAAVISFMSEAKVEWPRFTIALTRKEKEEDFLIFKGAKLPQRPKKRLKLVEKALLFCTPGNWLVELTQGRYDVREKKSTKKKPSGLKAMDSTESNSE